MLNNHMKAALERDLPAMAAKPRILICAPSNAAADELLQRVMDDRFADGDGRMYSPNVIRIGESLETGWGLQCACRKCHGQL
jgi:senataxin